VPDLAQSVRVAPHMLPKIGLLDPETIQSVINAYVLVDQYCEKLLLLGGHVREDLEAKTDRRLVHLSTDNSAYVITLNRNLSNALQKTIAQLDASLRTKRWWALALTSLAHLSVVEAVKGARFVVVQRTLSETGGGPAGSARRRR
jgi:hypothetical protein